MILGMCFICVIGVVWTITATAAKPGRARPRRDTAREQERRSVQLRSRPEQITTTDLETYLRTQLLPQPELLRVLNQVAARRLTPSVMWRWADRYGANRLVLALDAEIAERSMQRHLDCHTVPDWAAMELFASLATDSTPAGMPVDEVLDLDAIPTLADLTFPPDLEDWATAAGLTGRPSVEPLDLSQFSHLPPIAGPGLTTPFPSPEPGSEPSRDDEGGGTWPMAA